MKKNELTFMPVPQDGTRRNGKIAFLDEGRHVTLFIAHRPAVEETENGTNVYEEAYPIRVEKPVTRDKAINQAEMQAYRLTTPMEVASFGTALSRKFRENENDPEVLEHDELIDWVKAELTKIGI